MTNIMMDKTSFIAQFLSGAHKDVLPPQLWLAGQQYDVERVLRYLPGKRIVVEAMNQKQHLAIKLFADDLKGQRAVRRELFGHAAALAAGIPVPELMSSEQDAEGVVAVLYRYLPNAENLKEAEAPLIDLMDLVAAMHQGGIYQDDFHFNNVMCSNQRLHLVDLASVKQPAAGRELDQQTSLTNLAMLTAQFSPQGQNKMMRLLPYYFTFRGWKWDEASEEEFDTLRQKAWQRRKNTRVSKCFRAASRTVYKKILTMEYAFRRDFIDRVGVDFIEQLDHLMTQGTMLKNGNSATVVGVELAGLPVVIKRYNIKHWRHFLSRFWRPSRAAHSWKSANILNILDIAQPQVYGFIEHRFGPFRKQAYLVSEWQKDSQTLKEALTKHPELQEKVVPQVKQIFMTLKTFFIHHGDCKATNFLVNEAAQVSVIDLDGMQDFGQSSDAFVKAHQKDRQRFLRNWADEAVRSHFEKALEQLDD
jgi:tRNA A-37 threonylcarbamoyl transferase component Bud32